MFKLQNGLQKNYLQINFLFKMVFYLQRLQDGHYALILNFKQLIGLKRSMKDRSWNLSTWMKVQTLSSKTYKTLSKEVEHAYSKILIKN